MTASPLAPAEAPALEEEAAAAGAGGKSGPAALLILSEHAAQGGQGGISAQRRAGPVRQRHTAVPPQVALMVVLVCASVVRFRVALPFGLLTVSAEVEVLVMEQVEVPCPSIEAQCLKRRWT